MQPLALQLLGRVPEIDGLQLCVGFSSQGSKLGPAIGQLMAGEIGDGEPHASDISPLHLSRSAENKLLQGSYAGDQA